MTPSASTNNKEEVDARNTIEQENVLLGGVGGGLFKESPDGIVARWPCGVSLYPPAMLMLISKETWQLDHFSFLRGLSKSFSFDVGCMFLVQAAYARGVSVLAQGVRRNTTLRRPLRVAGHLDHPEERHIVARNRLRMSISRASRPPNSHMNEICPHLVNKNVFSPASEIFTVGLRPKLLKHSQMASIF